MVRNERQRERQQARKLERLEANTYSVPPGRSILEMLIEKLDHAMECYLHARTEKEKTLCRGEVRGMARAIALMQNPYHPTRNIKVLEQESASRVRRAHAEEQRAQEVREEQADSP